MMVGSVARVAAVACVCAVLSACGSLGSAQVTADLAYPFANRAPTYPTDDSRLFPDEDASAAPSAVPAGLECVPYAREHSNINIHGDAYTWWDKAAGIYARGTTPLAGAVMVLV